MLYNKINNKYSLIDEIMIFTNSVHKHYSYSVPNPLIFLGLICYIIIYNIFVSIILKQINCFSIDSYLLDDFPSTADDFTNDYKNTNRLVGVSSVFLILFVLSLYFQISDIFIIINR